ncbi:hypothetical protein B1772_04745 [Dehalococcoides mccartyi]|nr:hypothetical protein B1777_05340 [Dehalococcoides mccartyi]AQU07552.1 hypothetical protein B1778_05140 [Dehalococcoides mccartyi]AQX74798.1 hypothetical protein B1776_04435 [Dehalococcoides mccartyi]AQY73375.1 hypothetical protein B1772_04745 [Dehalococcoides mccartyi]
MWATARYDLHLTEDQFWRLTLKEYAALLKHHRINMEWQDYRAGLICSVLANINRDPKKHTKPYTPADFMPQKNPTKMTPEQMLAQIKLLNTVYNGNEV